jgi:hypothetical protein
MFLFFFLGKNSYFVYCNGLSHIHAARVFFLLPSRLGRLRRLRRHPCGVFSWQPQSETLAVKTFYRQDVCGWLEKQPAKVKKRYGTDFMDFKITEHYFIFKYIIRSDIFFWKIWAVTVCFLKLLLPVSTQTGAEINVVSM